MLWLVRAVQPRVLAPKAFLVAMRLGPATCETKSTSGVWQSGSPVLSAPQ